MSKTYKAWNGKEYPWPPPEGWYEASDNRWWAEDSGPGPKKVADKPASGVPASESTITHEAPTQIANVGGANPSQGGAAQPSAPFGTPAQNQQPQFGQPKQPSAPAQNQQPQFGQPQQFGAPTQGQQPQGGFGQPQQFGQNNWQSAQPEKSKNGLLIGLGAGAAALLLLVVGLVVATSGDSETEAVASPTVQTPATPSTLATTTTQEPTTTTAEPTTTTTEVDSAAANAGFRAHLDSIGVDASEATDSDLELAAQVTCIAAALSSTPADWDVEAEELVESSVQSQIDSGNASPLTRNQWRSVLDARLVFYCPDTAARLGVTV